MTVSPAGPRGEQPPAGGAPDDMALAIRALTDQTGRELTAQEIAALARLDDGDDGAPWDDEPRDDEPDPHHDPDLPPEWPTVPSTGHEARQATGPSQAAPAAESLDAGFTHRYGGTGTGFAGGGPLDVMLPGPQLAWYVGAARRAGLGALSDDELCGLLGAARRLGSWQAEMELAAVAELDVRRAGPDGCPGEHVEEEIAAVLTLTGRSSGALLGLSQNLSRLPRTAALLAAGILDRARAAVIADQLAVLTDADAAAVEDAVLPRAAGMTTGRLRAALDLAIKAHDPQAAARRREKAQKDARVECWTEPAGTSAIATRDMPPALVIAADKNLDADAHWLKQHGAPGTHEQLRAQASIARLIGQPLTGLLPQPSAGPAAVGTPGGPSTANTPAEPSTASTCASPVIPGWPGGLGGSVNLTMPALAWLGLTDTPGQISGLGAVDAETCRDLAAALAASPATRWCVTLVDARGRAVAHGCARAGPGPPHAGDPAAWLATVTITPIESGTCSHRRESAGYQPSGPLRHIVKVRSRRCGFPGCRRPAARCDDDHTIPYHKGGKTCECNLHPLCRRHHKAKQAPGWRLDQPEPGLLVWTLPSGRQYTVTPEPYPA